MTKLIETKKPALAAFHVRDSKGEAKAFWTRIGGAWPHRDGEGMTILLDCIPGNGRIVLRPVRAEGRAGAA